MKKKSVSGTREWASHNLNLPQTGCEHACRYCYARAMAVRFGRATNESWSDPVIKPVGNRVRFCKKYAGTIMFPTTHDLTPRNYDQCISVIASLLIAGNRLLIVSKPHLPVIMGLCAELRQWRDQILFRFTIGSRSDSILKFWEPGAPPYFVRLSSLKYAFKHGYATSVSIEPMLESPDVVAMFDELKPFVTDSIWIGKMNQITRRVIYDRKNSDERWAVEHIIEGQDDECIRCIYERLKDEPKVRWKESIKQVVGIPLQTEVGTDR